EKIIEEWKGIL
ncbi:GalNAc-alpha-(1-_4)-GalNAc-alpha-(1-_3)- diNAcBac-PP-undecaprenol alpha-1,4-N-acetyl-D-galactosaminyltransferase, partial [Haemophilus influenzae]